ncbi:MAG: hypothetical protein JOZ27_06460, partial [Caulobacteraceae bacterium]|nr:hypothetical protein [Caulobacteraceae bacterium]
MSDVLEGEVIEASEPIRITIEDPRPNGQIAPHNWVRDPITGRKGFAKGNTVGFTKDRPGTGRPRGCRDKITRVFLERLHDDFLKHGEKAIQKVRRTKPHEYLKVIASLVPKQIDLKEGA